jgi:hypothetical protein
MGACLQAVHMYRSKVKEIHKDGGSCHYQLDAGIQLAILKMYMAVNPENAGLDDIPGLRVEDDDVTLAFIRAHSTGDIIQFDNNRMDANLPVFVDEEAKQEMPDLGKDAGRERRNTKIDYTHLRKLSALGSSSVSVPPVVRASKTDSYVLDFNPRITSKAFA